MHLLNARTAAPSDGEAVDLGQSPGDIVVVSAADSELALLAAAQCAAGPDAPTLRLASLLQLGHPLSVDLYVETVVRQARLVVLRLLGGRSYWSYGLERVAAACRAGGIPLAALPGDDQPDPELDGWSSLPAADRLRLWRYLVHGGADNARQFLRCAAALIGRAADWREPTPLLRAGYFLPGRTDPDLDAVRASSTGARPVAAVVFYRALLQAGNTAVIEALVTALGEAGLDVLPVYVSSLRDDAAAALLAHAFVRTEPAVVLNTTGFAARGHGDDDTQSPLEAADAPILQVVLSGGSEADWRAGRHGLAPRDLAMHVVLPEVDGRILTRAVSFKETERFDALTECRLTGYRPVPDRVAFVVALAAAWVRLRVTPPPERRVALILANYPAKDGRLANGVGLDTPASVRTILEALAEAGYRVDDPPASSAALMNALTGLPSGPAHLDLADYRTAFAALPSTARDAVETRWGPPEADPTLVDGAFRIRALLFGKVAVAVQPPRGYQIDPVATYHSPDLPPPHHYLAFYAWLRHRFGAHAVVHVGKHGNLEWLPGNAVALSESCFPETALGPLPHVYPFIVNDPGEGSQAKRRCAAAIVDHLTPPLARAETYGPLRALEQRIDEYYEASTLDPRRASHLRGEIQALAERLGLSADLGLTATDEDERLVRLDAHLCELKELQIRDGLHVFGRAPDAERGDALLLALARVPRGRSRAADASLQRALAADLGLDFDPLDAEPATPWAGARPEPLARLDTGPWRTGGDTVERLELLALDLVRGRDPDTAPGPASRAVLAAIEADLRPRLEACAAAELAGLLTALDGRFLEPGPSGAPTRGRPDVLPTGRNFFSVDTRAVPTPAAWQLGWRSAALVVERYVQEHGDWPRRMALSAWGTANMRTGGDDIAQALALLGVRPTWDGASHRVTGIEMLPLSVLERPRVDVTLRISGFFRDAFPAQIELFDEAVRTVAALGESPEDNPLAAAVEAEVAEAVARGADEREARRLASFRVFGSKPGAYGAGLQALIDERIWRDDTDLAEVFVGWGAFAYGKGAPGVPAPAAFRRRLRAVEAVLHNQDNREHDILDSDDYYQFEGGLTAAVRVESGRQPAVYHNDHSRPETPRVRRLEEEIALIVRGRAANPKWIEGVMRHDYKGAFEMAATVDYLFAFAATTRLVADHHFDALFDAYLRDDRVRNFVEAANPAALNEMAERFAEARERGLWRPAANDVPERLDLLRRSQATMRSGPGSRRDLACPSGTDGATS